MDIYNLYHHCLTDSDKRYLAFLLKKEKVKASNELLVKDWINIVNVSVRLRHTLLANFCDMDIYPSQITAQMFLKNYKTGMKTWNEFQELRGDYI